MCEFTQEISSGRGEKKQKKVLIVYFSFSGQTQILIQKFAAGVRDEGHLVEIEKIQTVENIPFPFQSWREMMRVMLLSFFRWRVPVRPVDHLLEKTWDIVVIAGPTWSYNPSGPILHFLDHYGERLLDNTPVVPFISCRSYWRTHYWGLRSILNRCRAHVREPVVYCHSAKEPWRTIGLFLQLVGRLPRLESSWFRKRYPRYGHDRVQWQDAESQGRRLGKMLW